MKNLKLYCPKCGKELQNASDPVKKFSLFICDECKYSLTNSNTIDISFKSKGIAKALSNLCPYPFEFDGIQCSSMEAFIQSLKVQDIKMQKEVCSKTGPFCYSIREIFDDWRKTGIVYWKGKKIQRNSKEYIMLITSAYESLLMQSQIYFYTLKQVKENGYTLLHSIGCKDSTETLLTPQEFVSTLNHLIRCRIR